MGEAESRGNPTRAKIIASRPPSRSRSCVIVPLRDRAVEVAAFTGRRHTFNFLILSIKKIEIAQLRSCPRKIAPL